MSNIYSDSIKLTKENILFALSSLLISYFILHSTIQQKNNKYYLNFVYFVILTILLYSFFKFITYDKSSDVSIEKYTNGLDENNSENFEDNEDFEDFEDIQELI